MINGLRTTPSPDPVKRKKGARMKIKGGGDTEREEEIDEDTYREAGQDQKGEEPGLLEKPGLLFPPQHLSGPSMPPLLPEDARN